MLELTQLLTQTEVLLDSDILGTFIGFYFYLLIVLIVSFLNICSVDEYEFLNNKQKSFFEFKHKLFFIITYSKEKHIISKKTFITEIICYCLFILSVIMFVISLYKDIIISFILLGILAVFIFTFGCITGHMVRQTKKK